LAQNIEIIVTLKEMGSKSPNLKFQQVQTHVGLVLSFGERTSHFDIQKKIGYKFIYLFIYFYGVDLSPILQISQYWHIFSNSKFFESMFLYW
jgi:hypothetical protein